jgi:NADPH2:quinone reductase
VRAAVLRELGTPPEPGEAPEPAPGEEEVVLDVLVVPLNPIDIAVGAGRFYGGHPPLPYVPGCEGVGHTASGELVWARGAGLGARRDGCLAERVAVPEGALVPVPEGAGPALAGALGIAGLAGWLPFVWRAPLQEGESVLVLGATGAVGLVAVQAARLLGAGRIVAAGRSEEGLARALELGADAAVRLGEQDDADRLREACGGEGPSLIADPLWGEPLAAAAEAAAPGARLVNIGQSAGPETTITSAAVRGKQLEILGYSNFAAPPELVAHEYRRLVGHALAGDIQVDVEEVPFEGVAEAWRRQAESPHRKLIVRIDTAPDPA